jgi:hypothetical protein
MLPIIDQVTLKYAIIIHSIYKEWFKTEPNIIFAQRLRRGMPHPYGR